MSPPSAWKPSQGVERREVPRFPLCLAVALEHGEGCTRDISASGVFLSTQRAFSLGEPIRLVIKLEHVEPTAVLCVACEGEVVRVEPGSDGMGVAACITSYEFRRHQISECSQPLEH